jgi:hypothetical protein
LRDSGSAELMDAGKLSRKEGAMNALRRLAGGVGAVLLGLLLMATMHYAEAGLTAGVYGSQHSHQ